MPIDTVKDADGNTLGYRLQRKPFYLPYLMLAGQERAAQAPKKIDHEGYRSIETLAFEPDELGAIIEAAARMRALGDPILAGATRAALEPADVLSVSASPSREQPQNLIAGVGLQGHPARRASRVCQLRQLNVHRLCAVEVS